MANPFTALSAPLLLAALVAGAPASAAIIDSAAIGGFGTFTDTSTGRIWLDMNVFEGSYVSSFAKIGAANARGFTLATRADLNELFVSMPFEDWDALKPIVGMNSNASNYIGVFDDGDDNAAYGVAQSYPSLEIFLISNNQVANGATHGYLNVWAYQDAEVPEPAMIGLFGLGAIGLGRLRRRPR